MTKTLCALVATLVVGFCVATASAQEPAVAVPSQPAVVMSTVAPGFPCAPCVGPVYYAPRCVTPCYTGCYTSYYPYGYAYPVRPFFYRPWRYAAYPVYY